MEFAIRALALLVAEKRSRFIPYPFQTYYWRVLRRAGSMHWHCQHPWIEPELELAIACTAVVAKRPCWNDQVDRFGRCDGVECSTVGAPSRPRG